MASATIKIFLLHGDPKRLRTAELSNWTGKAVAGPRSEFDSVLAREESSKSGIYFLVGNDPTTGKSALYIGEAESIKDRVRNHIFAISALRAVGPDAKDATPELIKHLSSDDFHTQYWACRALGAIGPEARPATGELVRCLKTGVASVRRNAAAALGNIGPDIGQEAVDALIEALSDRIQPVRQNVVVALGQLKPLAAKAAPVIEKMLQEPSQFTPRAAAAKTLWQLDPQSKTPVQTLLRDLTENDEPWAAAQVFGEIKVADEAIQRLAALLDSPNVWTKQYAAIALLEIGAETQRAKATLEELARSEDEEIRESAAAALDKATNKASSPRSGKER